MIKKIIDALLVLIALPFLAPFFLLTWVLVKATSKGPALYWSKRVGVHNHLFNMPKFRSMHVNTPSVATHLLNDKENPDRYLTPVGRFIRKTSLDEIPQLWSVLKGDMAIVGPRPALFNQEDLIKLRTDFGVDKLLPGITGWAQVNGRDEISIPKKVELDVFYLKHQSFFLDCRIVFLTIIKVFKGENVSH